VTVALYDDVVGQERAVAQLRAAAAAPVHAYLLVGPAGSGKRAAALSFAAALLCSREGGSCGDCRDCRLALAEAHPDLTIVERVGASISKEQIDDIIRTASLTPVEARRKVIVPVDFHLVADRAPRLLKTIEEPPGDCVFVILAEDVPSDFVTIASRCVRIDFGPVPTAAVVERLVADGVDPSVAASVAEAAGGSIDRARLLANDPGFAERRAAWAAVPRHLDGSGAAVAIAVDDLLARIELVAEPLRAMQSAELAEFDEAAERYGDKRAATARRTKLEQRHNREVRRLRMDELRFGLAVLEGAYRDALRDGASARACVAAITAIDTAARELLRNPSESLFLQALFLRLTSCDADLAATA
jgi:DNA polymerase-3 subunit delta'